MKISLLILLIVSGGCRPPLDRDKPNGNDDSGEVDSGLDTDTGDTDEVIPGEEVAPTAVYQSSDPLFGYALDEGDIDGDLRDDLLVGAPGVERGGSAVAGPGRVMMIAGPLRTLEGEWSPAVTFHGITDGDAVGTSIAHGDFNRDGALDVAIGGGMPTAANPDMAGFVAVSSGPFTTDVALSRATLLSPEVAGDAFGAALAVADVTNDGFDDLAVGAPLGSQVIVYAGSSSGIGQVSTIVISGGSDMYFGDALASGDVNGDGVSDLLSGAPQADGVQAGSGACFLFAGPLEGSLESEYADAIYGGDRRGDETGSSVVLADVDGDGYNDVVSGAPGSDENGLDAGLVSIIYRTSDGPGVAGNTATLYGEQPGSAAGTSVAFAHDVNSDGVFDLVVGAPGYDNEDGTIDAGRGYLVQGPIDGAHSLLASDYVAGSLEHDRFGHAVLGDTELSGDSIADYLVGGPNVNTADVMVSGMVAFMVGY